MGSLTKGFHSTQKFLVQNYAVTADMADLDTPFQLRRIECKREQWESTICGLCGQVTLFS